MITPSKSLAVMVASAAMTAQVNGHGYMSDPAVTFTITGDTTQYIATIESSASGFSGTFSSDPATNAASFTTAFAASSYTSLKELIEDLGQVVSSDATLTCGYTDPDETAQALPETYVLWAHTDSEGFTASHEGPCEIWCDDTRVFQDDDCPADYTTAPAQLPYDRDACLGSSRLTFYWLALHSSTWQVYINCAALEETTSTGATSSYAVGSSSSTSATSTSTTASSSTGSTTSTSTSTTTAPSTTSATPTVTSASSTTTTSSSSTGTTTSSATGTSSSSNTWGSSTTTTSTSSPSTSTESTSANTWSSSTTTGASTKNSTTGNGVSNTGGSSNGNSNNNQGGTWTGGMSFGFN